MLRRRSRLWHPHSTRRGGRARTHVCCAEHDVDLAALQRFAADGRPSADAGAVEAIASRECPVCRPAYVAASTPSRLMTPSAGLLRCDCCQTGWSVENASWLAQSGGGLEMFDLGRLVPDSVTIDGSDFLLEAFDPEEAVLAAFRSELTAAFGSLAVPDGGEEDFLGFLEEGLVDALDGRSDLESQIWLALQERGFDDQQQQAWHEQITRVLGSIQEAMGGLVSIGLPEVPTVAAGPADRGHELRVRSGFDLPDDRFDELVLAAVESLPPEFATAFDNVALFVDSEHGERHIFGLYEGVPATARAGMRHGFPDRITIYKAVICRHCTNEAEVADQIRRTVLHEIGHYFGIGDARLRELGW